MVRWLKSDKNGFLILNKLKLALYTFFLLNILTITSHFELCAQNNDSFHVKWIEEFKSTSTGEENSGIVTKLLNFITGKEQTKLIRPANIVVHQENYWILDQGSKFINHIDFGNKNSHLIQDQNDNSFPSLVGICKIDKGEIYFTDSQNNKIYELNSDNKVAVEFASNIKLNKPTGIAYSEKSKSLFVCETGSHRILEIDLKGKINNILGIRGINEGEFNFPTYIWIDKEGLIYIVDSINFRVQIFDHEYNLISAFGEAGDGTGYLARPKGIATDSYGHIYIVDALFHNVQVFNNEGKFLYHFGNQGSGDGEFWLPMGIYIDKLNKIYVADSYNSRIQIFQLEKGKNIEN